MDKKHIVYLLKVNRKELPNKYIGSKSNCIVANNKIYCSRGIYVGSSKDKTYKEILTYCDYDVQVLGEFECYSDCLSAEKEIQLKYDVVASVEFFNKSIATINTYHNPEYGTYKHQSGKIARLPRNHPKVISGEWVGVTKGSTLSEETKRKIGRPGKTNPFYGKKHSRETKERIGRKIGDAHRGKPKSIEQRKKMSEARKRYWVARKKCEKNRQKTSI